MVMHECRAGARAVDLVGPSVYQRRPKFGIIGHTKHKSRSLQKSKRVDRGTKLVDCKARPAFHDYITMYPYNYKYNMAIIKKLATVKRHNFYYNMK